MTNATAHNHLDHLSLYRLPWSLTDNVIAWLEPTAKCNLACEGCYRRNVNEHKSLDVIGAELDTFARQRNFDGVSIAGGDPLLHPRVVDIVKMVAARGWKPVINTNGHALTKELLIELARAGLVGITFHIDSHQGRPGWRDKDEVGLCELRHRFASWVAEVGGISCAFNSTVYEDTLDQVPELVAWAQRHIDIVHTMVFIAYREADTDGRFDYFRGAIKVEPQPLVYAGSQKKQRADISSREVVAKIRERFPDFSPCAYLGGTEKPDSLKWLMASRIGTADKIFGYLGPKTMEVAQAAHHLYTGRYFAYAPESTLSSGRTSLAAAIIDPALRPAVKEYAGWVASDPRRALETLHVQAIMCIQPIDLLPDGRQNMCDACPDITVHEGDLVWSCRLDEQLQFGGQLRTVPRPACSTVGCVQPQQLVP